MESLSSHLTPGRRHLQQCCSANPLISHRFFTNTTTTLPPPIPSAWFLAYANVSIKTGGWAIQLLQSVVKGFLRQPPYATTDFDTLSSPKTNTSRLFSHVLTSADGSRGLGIIIIVLRILLFVP